MCASEENWRGDRHNMRYLSSSVKILSASVFCDKNQQNHCEAQYHENMNLIVDKMAVDVKETCMQLVKFFQISSVCLRHILSQ